MRFRHVINCKFCPKTLKFSNRGYESYRCTCKFQYEFMLDDWGNPYRELFTLDNKRIVNSFFLHCYDIYVNSAMVHSGAGKVPYFKSVEELENFIILQ